MYRMEGGFLLIAFVVSSELASAQCPSGNEIAKILADDALSGHQFGGSIAESDGVSITGATGSNGLDIDTGAAYIFESLNGEPTQIAKIWSSDGSQGDAFGISAALHGSVAVVGAIDDGCELSSGSAYVFEWMSGEWFQTAKLLPSNCEIVQHFGAAVAVSEDFIVVGAKLEGAGAVYVYSNQTGSWTETARLVAADGSQGDQFGGSLSISGQNLLIGASFDDDQGTQSGSAYIFQYVDADWVQREKLLASDGAENDLFGHSVAIDGSTALIGAFRDNGLTGAAYAYEIINDGWTQVAKLAAEGGVPSEQFGISVALSQDKAIVGANSDDECAPESGAAYLFHRVVGHWTQICKFKATDSAELHSLGNAVGLSGSTALVGAYASNDSTGAVYTFRTDLLAFAIDKESVSPGEQLQLAAAEGMPGGSLLLLLIDANGIPLFLKVLFDTFDGSGEWSFDTLAPDLFGLTGTFQVIGMASDGKIQLSNEQTVMFL